jgi:FtsZ-binding cell division protein ZapB
VPGGPACRNHASNIVDLKLYLMMLIEDFKKDINNSLKETQENTGKQVEALKEETQKNPLKNYRKTHPNRSRN